MRRTFFQRVAGMFAAVAWPWRGRTYRAGEIFTIEGYYAVNPPSMSSNANDGDDVAIVSGGTTYIYQHRRHEFLLTEFPKSDD